MKRARFTEKQIIGVLKEHEAGAKFAGNCFVGSKLKRIEPRQLETNK